MAEPAGYPDIRDIPTADAIVQFAAGFGTRFVVTVDTEEEFDWTKPLERFGHGLSHIPSLGQFQSFCENRGVAPVYLVDYPVACDERVLALLGPAVADGRAEIGVQLHPWVSPPHEEAITIHNSYAGNLSPALESAKFANLYQTIQTGFKVAPRIYRAGRYGVGAHTARMLIDGGISIDTSVRAGFDYRDQGGADFRKSPVRPWWIDRDGGLMDLPLTTVYCGLLRRKGRWLYHGLARVPALRGVLAQFGLLERVPLTPEGITIAEALRAIDAAIADRLPVLVFAFHSPSLRPGNTPYVRDDISLEALYAWWRAVFDHLRTRGVAPASMAAIAAAAQR